MSIAPLRWGGGTRLKILEAAAAECPVVSTTAGAEGLELEDGKEIAIADTADAFADAVTNLLMHPEKRRQLASTGRRKASDRYDWGMIAAELEKAYQRAIELVASGAFAS